MHSHHSGNTGKIIIKLKKSATPETAPENETVAKKSRVDQAEVIDAPRTKQDYFNDFKQALDDFASGKEWTATPTPPFSYQIRPLKEYIQTREQGLHAVLPLSTGMGKTYLFTTICALTNDRAIILVPQTNLINQTIESFKIFAPNVSIAKIKFKSYAKHKEQVLITTYQSMQKHYKEIDFSNIDSVIFDEAHKALSYDRVKMANKIKSNGAKVCAVTATPWVETRRDEEGGLQDVYSLCDYQSDGSDCPISNLSLRSAIDEHANAPVVMHHVMPTVLNNSKFTGSNNLEINGKQAARVMDSNQCNLIMADVYFNHRDPVNNQLNRGKKGIIFCSGVNHAVHVEEAFDEAIVSSNPAYAELVKATDHASKQKLRRLAAELIDPLDIYRRRYADNVAADYKKRTGEDLPQENWQSAYEHFRIVKAIYSSSADKSLKKINNAKSEKILMKFKLGGYLLLAGADKLIEGFDDNEITVVMFARPSRSWKTLQQQLGRGLRLNPNDGLKVCIAYQFHMTSDMNYHMIHELISDEMNPVFEYGDWATPARLLQANGPDQPAITVANLSEYRVVSEPSSGKIYLPPPKKRTPAAVKKQKTGKAASADMTQQEIDMYEHITTLESTLDEVLAFFNQIKMDIVKQEITNPTAPMASVVPENRMDKNNEGKRERAPEPMPDEIATTLADCQAKITNVREVISYQQTSSDSSSSSPQKLTIAASNEARIKHMQGQLNGLLGKLKALFKAKAINLFADELSDEDKNELQLLENELAGLIDSIQQAEVIKRDKKTRYVSNTKSKTKTVSTAVVTTSPTLIPYVKLKKIAFKQQRTGSAHV